jgi:O-succinylbenzoate synthase
VTISDVALYRYELPLTTPLQFSSGEMRRRTGLLVRVVTEQGVDGWGEAAPLPDFSAETLSDIVRSAQDLFSRWPGTQLPPSEAGLDEALQAVPLEAEGPPSLRFAVETAVVELIAKGRGTAIPAVLGSARSTVRVNALISHSDPAEGPAEAVALQDAGYQALKVKVGRAPVEDDIVRVRAIREALDSSVALRLDANRNWSWDQAVTFAEALSDRALDYVEEPLAAPENLGELTDQTGFPVALDESTRETAPSVLRDLPEVSAVVLKPTLLGGVRCTQDWFDAARTTPTTPVLSTSYESGVGLRMLAALAATGPETPVGLSTYDRLAADVYEPPLPLKGSTLDVASVCAPSNAQIAWDRLTLVDRFSR